MRTGTRRRAAALLAAALLVGGCSLLGDDEPSQDDPAVTDDGADGTVGGVATGAAGVIDAGTAALPAVSATYTSALCSVDPYAAVEDESPLTTLIGLYTAVPATSEEEQAEVARIVDALEQVRAGDDEAIALASSILRGRCTRVVVR